MRTNILFAKIVLAASLLAVPFVRAVEDDGAHFFVQPGVAVVSVGDDFKDTAAFTAAAGVAFAKHHSVEVEGVFFKAKSDVAWVPLELKYSIVLATYKYAFRFRHGLSVFAGASVGQTKQSASVKPGFYIIGDKSDDTSAYGVTGGVSYRLNPNVEFTAGGKILGMDKTRFTTSGGIIMLQGAVRFLF